MPTFPELFAEQVRRTPDAPALTDGRATASYAQLDTAADAVAHLLLARGVGPEQLVGIALRSSRAVEAIIGVLKTGAGYLPIDLSYPAQRIEFTLRHARPPVVLTSAADAALLPDLGPDGPVRVLLDDPETVAELAMAPTRPVTDTDRHEPLLPRHPAYVIYTSGSTGEPKGVVIEHRQLTHYLTYARNHYPGLRGRALLHSSLAFDLTITALFAPLISGGLLHVTTLKDAPNGIRPAFVKVTPSHVPLLSTLPPAASPTGELMAGGELLLGEVVDAWRRRNPGARVVNEYGPTETTVGCSTLVIEPGDEVPPGPLPIGQPMPGTAFHVLDDRLRPTPVGEIGELYIAGDQLARGYLGRPSLTAARFVANPFGPPGSRMYRSGDLIRPTADGGYEFMGRIDTQTKINGYRIELGEVEAAFTRHPDVAHAAAVVRGTRADRRQLVAYVVWVDGAAVDAKQLLKHVAQTLPDYSVPVAVVALPALPLTPNGKLDVAALPAPQTGADGYHPPTDDVQRLLCDLFEEFVQVEPIGIDDDFFHRGGTSVGAAQLVNEARRRGLHVGLRDLMDNRTPRRLSDFCRRAAAGSPSDAPD
ncbi:amino acid adenylation domain-containing protein [Micromonospora sp. WMMD1082]|uniref:non-ribosomal peptide synthetase n=1 Tax=Micromonospora sp. WMMD1082 TaxID=3016104 RepID=UPI002416A2BE|nr:amino acid adenylation domain-containing protein [Micromonospora sp. WMMD1082]MDG4794555.1 amino acid adenylation domain-containing protein [Micromonospora sp. WMMD1082]